jgi:C4-dicarboxylate-specific signal transduction histidine kinase
LKRKNIHIEVQMPREEIFVNIDPRALHQVMLNLVTNAADALSNRPDARIAIRAEAEDQLVWLIVKDNGCGMTKEQIEMLFQPFYTDKVHGNGLGLVITRKLLTMMQASITINSCVDKGSTARIGLSLAIKHETETLNDLNGTK